MPLWKITPIFANSDVYIIGGGVSLDGFDWSLLKGKFSIGCNAAALVADCSLCFFSDRPWFIAFRSELEEYVKNGGKVFTHCKSLLIYSNTPELDWLNYIPKEKYGMHTQKIGMNGNSGASAVNLALMLGAKRVFLLGFDCKPPVGEKSHWHGKAIEDLRGKALFDKFMEGWRVVNSDLQPVFPGRQIINLGPDSAIPYFPREHYSKYLYHAENNRRTG